MEFYKINCLGDFLGDFSWSFGDFFTPKHLVTLNAGQFYESTLAETLARILNGFLYLVFYKRQFCAMLSKKFLFTH
jgi:hypothetical protein